MYLPRSIRKLIEALEKLPGIGPKTAQRLTFYLLNVPQRELDAFSEAVVDLKRKTVLCSRCFNVGEADPCKICSDPDRDRSVVCVVESPLDVLALEKAEFKGLYHVLGGSISPLNSIGPEELRIGELIRRLKEGSKGTDGAKGTEIAVPSVIGEVILATNPDMEGEATAMYLKRLIQPSSIKVTRIGRGLPVGGDLEYADKNTVSRALEGRREY